MNIFIVYTNFIITFASQLLLRTKLRNFSVLSIPFAKFLMLKCQKELCSKLELYCCSVVAHSDQFRNLCPKVSDAHPKTSDAHPKASDVHPKASDAHPKTSDARPKVSDVCPKTSDEKMLRYAGAGQSLSLGGVGESFSTLTWKNIAKKPSPFTFST